MKLFPSYFVIFLLFFSSCFNSESNSSEIPVVPQNKKTKDEAITKNPNKNLYWGDTHLHTNFSSDAFLFGTIMASPDEAFRFAKGEVMVYPPTGEKIQINRPLDFLVVTDHAEGLGTMIKARDKDPLLLSTEAGRRLAKIVEGKPGIPMFLKWLRAKNLGGNWIDRNRYWKKSCNLFGRSIINLLMTIMTPVSFPLLLVGNGLPH